MPSVRIVGAGVAGCAAAATALELGYQVTVYEAGPGHPLPPALRSPDLNRARSAHRWWWPHSYLAGRGLGGSSAVNGMVLQMPLEPSPEATWAWMALDPAHAEPGPLAVRLGEASTTARFEPTWLALASGARRTAADVWLADHPHLTVQTGFEVDPQQVIDWNDRGEAVLVAAGALRSPALAGAAPGPVLDHPSVVVGFEPPSELRLLGDDTAVATSMARRGNVQVLLLERAGTDPARAALVVSCMVEANADEKLAEGVAWAGEILEDAGLTGEVMDEPSPVAHACCTLTGRNSVVPVVDASTLPHLPAVNPMVTVAAHARRRALDLLG